LTRLILMITLTAMAHVVFEDRTQETVEQTQTRQLRMAAGAVTRVAAELCQGEPELTLRLMATALGQAMAQAGGDTDAVLAVLRHERDAMKERLLMTKKADA
jgi:hypothetical protein